MTRLFALPVLLLSASLLLAPGCGSDPASPPNVAEALAETQCDLVADCYPELMKLYGGSSCAEEMTRQYQDSVVAVIDALEADGEASFDAEAASECLDLLETLTCAELGDSMTAGPCRGMFAGAVPEGEPCQDDWSCADGGWCDSDGSCPGTCKATVGLGEACGEGGTHQSFMSCGEGQCVYGTCQRIPGQGEACTEDGSCAWGLLCDDGTCQDRNDYRTAQIGEACDGQGSPPVLCAADLFCVSDGAGGGECVGEAPSGGACPLAFADNCPAGEYCDFDWIAGEGTCTALAGEGQACGEDTLCDTGLYCDAGSGTCRTYGQIGEACTEDDDCYSESCEGGVCAVKYSCE